MTTGACARRRTRVGAQIRAWLRQRFADRDRLVVDRIFNENRATPSGVAGVEWARRRSDTLKRLGLPNEIVPRLGAKVVFARAGPARIMAFANGPIGGSPESCRPSTSQPPSPHGETPSNPYGISGRQAEGIGVVIRFLDAYNAGKPDAALALFTKHADFVRFVGVSDCDYRRGTNRRYFGRAGVREWLRARAANRDRLTPRSDPERLERRERRAGRSGTTYSRRTSNTLRALGYPNGIDGGLGSKIGFTTRGPVRITTLALAGDDQGGCRPRP